MRGILAVLFASCLLAGCSSTPQRDRNIVAGAAVGAGLGALIGSASGGPPTMWAGAAIGAVSGGLIGSLIRGDACYYTNRRGEVWQVPCNSRVFAKACAVADDPDTRVECRRG